MKRSLNKIASFFLGRGRGYRSQNQSPGSETFRSQTVSPATVGGESSVQFSFVCLVWVEGGGLARHQEVRGLGGRGGQAIGPVAAGDGDGDGGRRLECLSGATSTM